MERSHAKILFYNTLSADEKEESKRRNGGKMKKKIWMGKRYCINGRKIKEKIRMKKDNKK